MLKVFPWLEKGQRKYYGWHNGNCFMPILPVRPVFPMVDLANGVYSSTGKMPR